MTTKHFRFKIPSRCKSQTSFQLSCLVAAVKHAKHVGVASSPSSHCYLLDVRLLLVTSLSLMTSSSFTLTVDSKFISDIDNCMPGPSPEGNQHLNNKFEVGSKDEHEFDGKQNDILIRNESNSSESDISPVRNNNRSPTVRTLQSST